MAIFTAGAIRGLGALGVLGSRQRKPIGLTVRIVNQEELEFAFRLAPELMATNLNKGIKKSTLLVERESRIHTSGEMVNVQTGLLRASHRSRFKDLKGTVSVNPVRGGAEVNYAWFVHEGTIHMRPRPFLEDAVDDRQSEVVDIMQGSVQDTLDTIGGLV